MAQETEQATEHPLVGRVYPPVVRAYDVRDVALYAVGVGAGALRSERLVWEGARDFAALPTFPLVLPMPDMLHMGIPEGSDLVDVVHGEQSLELHAPVPTAGEAVSRCSVTAARDKGAAGIFDVLARIEVDEVHVATATYSVFVKGAGGWGGPRGSSARPGVPEGGPDVVLEHTTSPDQALVYRLSGDLNPLHVSEEVARRSGFDRPILHGLSTLGTAVLLAEEQVRAGAGGAVVGVAGRFTGHVFPGERLRVVLWDAGDLVGRVEVVDRGATVVDGLTIRLS